MKVKSLGIAFVIVVIFVLFYNYREGVAEETEQLREQIRVGMKEIAGLANTYVDLLYQQLAWSGTNGKRNTKDWTLRYTHSTHVTRACIPCTLHTPDKQLQKSKVIESKEEKIKELLAEQKEDSEDSQKHAQQILACATEKEGTNNVEHRGAWGCSRSTMPYFVQLSKLS